MFNFDWCKKYKKHIYAALIYIAAITLTSNENIVNLAVLHDAFINLPNFLLFLLGLESYGTWKENEKFKKKHKIIRDLLKKLIRLENCIKSTEHFIGSFIIWHYNYKKKEKENAESNDKLMMNLTKSMTKQELLMEGVLETQIKTHLIEYEIYDKENIRQAKEHFKAYKENRYKFVIYFNSILHGYYPEAQLSHNQLNELGDNSFDKLQKAIKAINNSYKKLIE